MLYLGREGLEALEGSSGTLKSKHGREGEREGRVMESGDEKKRRERKRRKEREIPKKRRGKGGVDENK